MPDIAFVDSETRSIADVTRVGAYKYAKHPTTDCLIWAWAFDDDHAQIWSPSWCYGNHPSTRGDSPESIQPLLDFVAAGGYVVAWNMFFDRNIWNEVMVKKYGWPPLPVEQSLCAQAQAEANNLPGKLEKACQALGTTLKDGAGKALIELLCQGAKHDWNSLENETPERMGRFRAYGRRDVESMRDVWRCTRPLAITEWQDYWVSEKINERGVAVDAEFAAAAREYAADENADLNADLADLTGDARLTVTAHLRKARWLHDQLWPDEELQQLTKRPPKTQDGPERFSCDRPTREAVSEALLQPEHAERFELDHLDDIQEFLEIIEAGNSAAVNKFKAIVNMEWEGRVYGQYSFNGAGQTGRFSSRGIQVHNLIRDPVEKGNPNRAIDAMESILLEHATPMELEDEYGFPVSRLLARLIRPTFIAAPGKTFVWGDWSQIEARVLPWLSNSPGGNEALQIFESGEDVYKHAATAIFGCQSTDDVTDWMRQIGKVAILSLGFGGAYGAFSAMGRGYGVYVDPAQGDEIVTAWRRRNSWCVNFWHALWDAAIAAHACPGRWFPVGRVKYLFHPDLMRGTLICCLPCGRWLVYPQFRREWAIVEDKKTGEKRERFRTTFVRGFGGGAARIELWYGILAENITQAAAASCLRSCLKKLDRFDFVVLHTHDEIIGEVHEREARKYARLLKQTMLDKDDWMEGLPMDVEIETGPFYTK